MPNFKEHTSQFIATSGLLLGLARLIFYPVTQTLITPLRFIGLLHNCRVLLKGNWGAYSGFAPQTAFNNIFYWIRALNIFRYGRSGRSPYIGLGNYPLARTFYYSLASLYAFWKAPLITILAGMFGWLLFHGFWMNGINDSWILMVGAVTLISSLFYMNIIQQNYNALGWLFFPLFLYGLLTDHIILAAAALLLSSFASITVVFLGGIIALMMAFQTFSLIPLITVIPSAIKFSIHLIPLLKDSASKNIVVSIMKAIGMSGKDVKYKRTKKGKIDILFIYFSGLYLQFAFVYYYIYDELSILFLTGIFIYWINKLIMRFADEQSIYMLMMSLGFASLALQGFDIIILLSYWFMVNPFPLTTNIYDPANIDLVPRGKPFNINRIIHLLEAFLKDVSKDQKVLMSFNDPNNDYEKIFDGYRRLVELPHYVANLKEFRFMPDWWGVFELNYAGAPDFWGRDIDRVMQNIKTWEADYLLVYQKAGTALDTLWESNGFEVLETINWQEVEEELNYKRFYKPESPSWWILKVPEQQQ